MPPKASQDSLLQQALDEALAGCAAPGQPLCLALSGGRDSVVLLHALRHHAVAHPLRALHVDHGLHPDSSGWAETCAQLCASAGVPLEICTVEVARDSGRGLEAAAREARYAALAARLAPDELLVTAHHRNDQVETLLLQLLRGAGMHGIAAMPVRGEHNGVAIIRPLLAVAGQVIQDYATAHGLAWIEDPSNQDASLDRNFLRREILPRIVQRWPAALQSVARTARLAGEAAELLDELADSDLQPLQSGNRIDLGVLRSLSTGRQRNALRRALRRLDLAVPADRQLTLLLATMLGARPDAEPLSGWPGVRVRRYRETLYLYAEAEHALLQTETPACFHWNPATTLDMGPVRGTLAAEACRGEGIAAARVTPELMVRFREGSETLRPAAGAARRDLKNLLQENNVVPWMRKHIPLICSGGQVLAIGDLWVDADCAARPDEAGLRIIWGGHAPLR